MAQVHDVITPELAEFIAKQPMFFVATAPLSAEGRVNLSPKGLNTFRVLSPTRVAYLDLTGSGIETAAHVGENGRITFMFCEFSGPPKILRLYGKGRMVGANDAHWEELAARFDSFAGVRHLIVAEIDRVQTSCGFGVPKMELIEQRDVLVEWAGKKSDQQLKEYWGKKNSRSIDGLRGMVVE